MTSNKHTELLALALDRMDRARSILTCDNPRPECNWGMLDTTDLRESLQASESVAIDAPPPSGERADLIAALRRDFDEDRTDFDNIKNAADMLAADAQEIQRVTEMARTEKRLADMHCEEKLAIKAQQMAAPQARELSDEDIDLIWRTTLVDNQQEICRVTRIGRWFARAVLAARSES